MRPENPLIVGALCLGFALACGGDQEEPEPAPEAEQAPIRLPLNEAFQRPPPLEAETQSDVLRDLVDDVDMALIPAEPAVGGPGAPIAERDDGVLIATPIDIDRYTLEGITRNLEGRAQTAERLMRTEPSVTLGADGVALLRFETLDEIAGANITYGGFVPEDPLGLARLRKYARLESAQGREFTIDFDLRRLMKEKYDVQHTLQTGRGTAAYRLEVLDPRIASSRAYDGEIAFRCDPCAGDDADYVQLPTIVQGPTVDMVTETEASIRFLSDAATAGFVALYAEGVEPEILESGTPGVEHELHLSDLDPGTRYRFHPIVVDARGEASLHRGGTFETHPESLEQFEFVVMSDSRSGQGSADEHYAGTNARVLRSLLLQAIGGDPRFVVFVGDLADGYTTHPGSFDHELRAWQRVVQPVHAHLPIYEAMGNHESVLDLWASGHAQGRRDAASAEAIFARNVVNPLNGPDPRDDAPPYEENTYSFDVGSAHMAVFNTNYFYRSHADDPEHPAQAGGQREGFVDDETLAWLEQDLSSARERGQRHLFVATHEPGFPNGGHTTDGMWWEGAIPAMLERRAALFRLLADQGVLVVFHGDEHNYSRTRVDEGLIEGMSRPVWQIVTGGAGAPYYAQEREVPWADQVERFDARQHFVRVRVGTDSVHLEAVPLGGGIIERFQVVMDDVPSDDAEDPQEDHT